MKSVSELFQCAVRMRSASSNYGVRIGSRSACFATEIRNAVAFLPCSEEMLFFLEDGDEGILSFFARVKEGCSCVFITADIEDTGVVAELGAHLGMEGGVLCFPFESMYKGVLTLFSPRRRETVSIGIEDVALRNDDNGKILFLAGLILYAWGQKETLLSAVDAVRYRKKDNKKETV